MEGMIEWHDIVRVAAFLVNLYSFVVLVILYFYERDRWGVKSKDLWYGLVMWVLAGLVFSVQGIVLDRPFTVGFVFLSAATFVTGKVVHGKVGSLRASHIL